MIMIERHYRATGATDQLSRVGSSYGYVTEFKLITALSSVLSFAFSEFSYVDQN